jgi:hypothetical protein
MMVCQTISESHNHIDQQGLTEGDGATVGDSVLAPDLQAVIDAWPDLPQPVRAAILQLVKHTAEGGQAR